MNGWKNKATWNVAMTINNDESLYRSAVKYANKAANPNYRELIATWDYQDSRTHDGYDWISDTLDYDSLDDMVKELIDN